MGISFQNCPSIYLTGQAGIKIFLSRGWWQGEFPLVNTFESRWSGSLGYLHCPTHSHIFLSLQIIPRNAILISSCNKYTIQLSLSLSATRPEVRWILINDHRNFWLGGWLTDRTMKCSSTNVPLTFTGVPIKPCVKYEELSARKGVFSVAIKNLQLH